jgi:arrestin-related trafficking adapter 3/6
MRISRLDPEDPAGKRRRHFEISIDSPFTVLNCRATQANTSLPQYYGRDGPASEQRQQFSCGCSDAHAIDGSASTAANIQLVERDMPGSQTLSRFSLDTVSSATLPSLPQAAHLPSLSRSPGSLLGAARSDDVRGSIQPPSSERGRPIHMLRHPSFNPPPFDADEAPPLPADIMTPPPNYDVIVGTPSVDGLADYFARLAVYEGPGQARLSRVDRDALNRHCDEEQDPLSPGTGGAGRPTPSTSENDPFSSLVHSTPGEPTLDDDSSDSGDDDPARPHRRGRVNVANPRTPGGRLIPSRSLEIERPVMRLDMTGVIRRDRGNA